MTDSVVFRPAKSDPAEGKAFAQYLETAADDLFPVLFGTRAEAIIARAYSNPGHDLSYEHVVFAEKAGNLVGMVSGYTAAQHRQSADAELLRAAGFIRSIRMLALTPFAFGLIRFMNRVDDGDYYLQAVAVDESTRGEGVGSQLLDLAEERARDVACRRFVLDVASTNAGARRLYERRGMTIAAESPAIAFVPDSSVYRMEKRL